MATELEGWNLASFPLPGATWVRLGPKTYFPDRVVVVADHGETSLVVRLCFRMEPAPGREAAPRRGDLEQVVIDVGIDQFLEDITGADPHYPPYLKVQLDRRPELVEVRVGEALEYAGDGDELAPISPTLLRDLPWAALVDAAVAEVSADALIYLHAVVGVRLSRGDLDAVRQSAVDSRRGKPVDDETLQRVAAIVNRGNFAFRDEVAEELSVSRRTASRWISKARERGLITGKD